MGEQWAHAPDHGRLPCPHCRGHHRDRQIWSCRRCGVQACQRHIQRRFGLKMNEAEDVVAELEARRRPRLRGQLPAFLDGSWTELLMEHRCFRGGPSWWTSMRGQLQHEKLEGLYYIIPRIFLLGRGRGVSRRSWTSCVIINYTQGELGSRAWWTGMQCAGAWQRHESRKSG